MIRRSHRLYTATILAYLAQACSDPKETPARNPTPRPASTIVPACDVDAGPDAAPEPRTWAG
jgi:hypothetical protein